MSERLSASEKILRTITEAEWQGHVIQVARLHGWVHYHAPANRPGRNGQVQKIVAGWPDLFLIRDGDVVAAELKTRTGRTTEAQEWWLAELRKAGIDSYVWRPGDDDKILARLRRKK
jgi:hypothetical protein